MFSSVFYGSARLVDVIFLLPLSNISWSCKTVRRAIQMSRLIAGLCFPLSGFSDSGLNTAPLIVMVYVMNCAVYSVKAKSQTMNYTTV